MDAKGADSDSASDGIGIGDLQAMRQEPGGARRAARGRGGGRRPGRGRGQQDGDARVAATDINANDTDAAAPDAVDPRDV
eukprot:1951560-Alexandrium_andersonii.AAC.1